MTLILLLERVFVNVALFLLQSRWNFQCQASGRTPGNSKLLVRCL
ncbi:hypothetical protein M758_5G037200 [Ceratodon purpureus]|uniref:Uncharacterized protein n=1 Tax=Ceratodon purpureus TaxID=3225 RepID=A0A8T0HZP4_CERPU|nr:hypothetical protein KC19_5G037300 [Ceratodon purpureus]KAG0615386.1 hypothetical protein M758_5G037200 [Ceratodon purpureus]